MLTLDLGAKTDRGRSREKNEDAILVRHRREPSGGGVQHLLVVADGMGGAAGGDTASREAIRALEREFEASTEQDPGALLRRAFQAAHDSLRRLARQERRLSGMGTTLVAAVMSDTGVCIANVGDSRCYMISEGSIRQVTEDHSWVGEQVRAGVMTTEEAGRSLQRNIITRSIGSEDPLRVDIFGPYEVGARDTLIICSDGLYGVVTDEEIEAAVAKAEPAQAVEHLVNLANRRGGPDNISVIVSRVTDQVGETATIRMTRPSRLRPFAAIAAALGVVLTGGILLATALFVSGGDDDDGLVGEFSITPTPAHGPSISPDTAASLQTPSPSGSDAPASASEPPTPTPSRPEVSCDEKEVEVGETIQCTATTSGNSVTCSWRLEADVVDLPSLRTQDCEFSEAFNQGGDYTVFVRACIRQSGSAEESCSGEAEVTFRVTD